MVVVLIAVALIGWADHASGPHVAFSLFYLVPVTVGAFWFGRATGLLAALAASAAWFAADFDFREQSYFWIAMWNSFTRLGVFVSIGWLTATVRSDRDRLKELLAREGELARTDALTGLSNSRALLEAIERELARVRRTDTAPCAVVYLDLDNFKQVNDRFGHGEGDRLLARVGQVLHATVRATDIAARVGGDEFVVLLWNVELSHATQTTERIIADVNALGSAYPGSGLGVSAGLAYFAHPPADADASSLLRQADAALYEGKRGGKGSLVVADFT